MSGAPSGRVVELDLRGLLCPLPVIRVQDRVAELGPGDEVVAVCSDPGALNDIPAWCKINGHFVLWKGEREGDYVVHLRVGGHQE